MDDVKTQLILGQSVEIADLSDGPEHRFTGERGVVREISRETAWVYFDAPHPSGVKGAWVLAEHCHPTGAAPTKPKEVGGPGQIDDTIGIQRGYASTITELHPGYTDPYTQDGYHVPGVSALPDVAPMDPATNNEPTIQHFS